MGRVFRWSGLVYASLFIVLLVVQTQRQPALAQGQPAVTGVSAGSLFVTGNRWNFDADIALGTDTADTSPSLSLAGSPGSGQIEVKYSAYAPSDPLCCPSLPPVTITYTSDGTSVTASGIPPGH